MSAFGLALAFLRRRWGQALLSMFVGALGIGAVETALVAERAIPAAANRAFGGVDLVVGSKSAAVELMLCCALHVLEPRGLVSMPRALGFLSQQPMVKTVAPIALGDNVKGLRIVGTTTGILSIYKATLSRGRSWSKSFEAVLGAQAAKELGLAVGDTFKGTHGLGDKGEDHEHAYAVTGILAPTGSAIDRLVLTDIKTVHKLHAGHNHAEAADDHSDAHEAMETATAILVNFRSPLAMASLPRLVDATEDLSAASPTIEMARLMRAGRPMISATVALGVLFTGIAIATAATALMAAMSQRVKDLALLRVLGASPWRIGLIALAESGIYVFGGIIMGLAFAAGLLHVIAALLAERNGLLLQVTPAWNDVRVILIGGAFAAVAAAVFPAIRAHRAPIETVLNP